MHQIFTPAILSADEIVCPKCDWKGKGAEVRQEDLFLTDAIELFCPQCNNYFGFVSRQDSE